MAEFMSGEERAKSAENSKDAYQSAEKVAQSLDTTHPIRLGLALNFSVFHYEIMNNPDKACSLARVVSEGGMVVVWGQQMWHLCWYAWDTPS